MADEYKNVQDIHLDYLERRWNILQEWLNSDERRKGIRKAKKLKGERRAEFRKANATLLEHKDTLLKELRSIRNALADDETELNEDLKQINKKIEHELNQLHKPYDKRLSELRDEREKALELFRERQKSNDS